MRFSFLVFTFVIVILILTDARASSFGMSEGPQGCDWEATVEKAGDSKDSVYVLKLVAMKGTCMYEPSFCGNSGDLVSVSAATKFADQYHVGQTVHIWVSSTPTLGGVKPTVIATFDHPTCSSTAPDQKQ